MFYVTWTYKSIDSSCSELVFMGIDVIAVILIKGLNTPKFSITYAFCEHSATGTS